MKALNQYTFAGAVSALFLVTASVVFKSAAIIGVLGMSFATFGVFSTAFVFFWAGQLAYNYFFPDTATSTTKPTSSTALTTPSPNTPEIAPIPERLGEQAQAMIGIDMNKICQTSGWYNNCGLNCMTHFMFTKLSSLPKNQFAKFLKDNPEYDAFLSTFQNYYGLKQKPNWAVVLDLLADHTRSDREAIFAPVLRSHIGKIMPTFANEFWETKFAGAISDYIKTGSRTDVANAVYVSNKAFFEKYKAQFDAALEKAKKAQPTKAERQKALKNLQLKQTNKDFEGFVITEEAILDNIELQRISKLEDKMLPLAKAHWLTKGCKDYADYVADLETAEMISADQLQWLGERFNIGVEVYTPDSMTHAISHPELAKTNQGMQWKPEGNFKWMMRVHNRGVHWTFEEANQSQAARDEHNARFYNDGDKSSQYKSLRSISETTKAIKQAIQERMNAPKMLLHKPVGSTKKTTAAAVVVAKVIAKKKTYQRR